MDIQHVEFDQADVTMMQPDLSKWGWVGFGGVEKLGVKLARNHEFHFLFSTIIIMERQQNDRFGGHSSNKKATIGTELSKIIVRRSICDKKIPTETAEAVSEVLRMFVIEARARASIEVGTIYYVIFHCCIEVFLTLIVFVSSFVEKGRVRFRRWNG